MITEKILNSPATITNYVYGCIFEENLWSINVYTVTHYTNEAILPHAQGHMYLLTWSNNYTVLQYCKDHTRSKEF